MIRELKNSIVIENDIVEITLSNKTAIIEKVILKKTKTDIKGEETVFFAFVNEAGEYFKNNSLTLNGNVITLDTEIGKMDVEVKTFPRYFEFELLTELPEKCYNAVMSHIQYEFESKTPTDTAVTGLALTYWADPVYSPNRARKETLCKVVRHLKDKNARYALVISDFKDQRDILKEATLTIDKNTGVRSSIGGAFALDSRINFGNYNIQYQSNQKDFRERLPYYKQLGIDQLDFHHGYDTFRQGDFKFVNYENAKDFKKQVSDVLAENNMYASLHTYTAYIDDQAEGLLSKPENLKMLTVKRRYTLKEDLLPDSEYVMVEEDISDVVVDNSFYTQNSPSLLIGDEIIKIEKDSKGFKIVQRGDGGTKSATHKKGDEVKHLFRFYWGYFPLLNSPLFYEVARNTAKAFNEGGFKMIYLDACEGIHNQCKKDEIFYYVGAFVCEILKYCEIDPILEGSAGATTIWAAGGRRGAFDSPSHGYKGLVKFHSNCNIPCVENHSATTLGWYDFYPMKLKYPGNEHCKYQHTDDVDYIGTLATIYDYSMAFNNSRPEDMNIAAMRRNMAIFRKYDDLRKAQYFSKEYREKILACGHECQLKEKRGGKFVFVEKDYQKKKLFNLNEEKMNVAEFKNPFGKQTPFVRIEALLSSKGENPLTLLPIDENRDLTEQVLSIQYPSPINLDRHLAKCVRVKGNGKKSSAIAIKIRQISGHPLLEYIIDTDFTGWRDFVLLETDNGERPDLPFDKKEHYWPVYGASFDHAKVQRISVETENADGVRMSSIKACEHLYDVLSNPTVKIGESEVKFNCEIKSSDFIEFDGKKAVVIDRYGNERPIHFTSTLTAPRGKFKAQLTAESLNKLPARAILTFGFTGKEIK